MLLYRLEARGRRSFDWEHRVAPELLLRLHPAEGWHFDFDQLGAEDAEIRALLGDRLAPVIGMLRC